MPLNCLGGTSRNLSFLLFVSRTGFEEKSSGKCHNSFNAGIAGMVPKGTSDEHSRSSLNPKGTQSSNKTRFSTTPSGGKQNATTEENLLQRDFLKVRSLLSQMQEDQVLSIIMNRPGKSEIAGVINRVLIPFDVI